MNKKYYTSDLHLGHDNILKYDNRPFPNTHVMAEEIKKRWNAKVDSGDMVYILGDVIWKNREEDYQILKSLNGQKHLILGNHDRPNHQIKQCFVSISEYKEVKDEDRHVILSHYPIHCYKNHYRDGYYMLYGHVHATKEYESVKKMQEVLRNDEFRCEMFNVGCMLHDYEPVTLNELIKNGDKNEQY